MLYKEIEFFQLWQSVKQVLKPDICIHQDAPHLTTLVIICKSPSNSGITEY